MLIESGKDRQIYDCTTNEKEFRLFAKYRSAPVETKAKDYSSWQFTFSSADINDIKAYLASGKELSLGLVCGMESLNKSEYAVVKREKIEELLIKQGKTSITISRMKGEHDFRISVGGGRENALRVKANEIY